MQLSWLCAEATLPSSVQSGDMILTQSQGGERYTILDLQSLLKKNKLGYDVFITGSGLSDQIQISAEYPQFPY